MNQRVDSVRVLGGVGRRWWLILLLMLVGAGAGYAVAAVTEPAYQATGSLLVGRPFEAANLDKDHIEVSQQLAQAYADVARRRPVLEDVVDELGLNTTWTELRDRTSADVPEVNPQLIVITVEAGSPADASEISNQILDRMVGLSPTQSQKSSPNQLQVLETGESKSTPVRPVTPLYTALAGGAGFFVGLALAYALEFRRERTLSREFAARERADRRGLSSTVQAPPPPPPSPRQGSEEKPDSPVNGLGPDTESSPAGRASDQAGEPREIALDSTDAGHSQTRPQGDAGLSARD